MLRLARSEGIHRVTAYSRAARGSAELIADDERDEAMALWWMLALTFLGPPLPGPRAVRVRSAVSASRSPGGTRLRTCGVVDQERWRALRSDGPLDDRQSSRFEWFAVETRRLFAVPAARSTQLDRSDLGPMVRTAITCARWPRSSTRRCPPLQRGSPSRRAGSAAPSSVRCGRRSLGRPGDCPRTAGRPR